MATRSRQYYWAEFEKWCVSRKMKALPAHPWTIARYLRWVDEHKETEDVKESFDAISREHVLKTGSVPTRHETVKSTMDLIERRSMVRDQHSDLFDEDEVLEDKVSLVVEEPAPAPEPKSHVQSVQGRHQLSTKPHMVRRRPQK